MQTNGRALLRQSCAVRTCLVEEEQGRQAPSQGVEYQHKQRCQDAQLDSANTNISCQREHKEDLDQ